MAMIANQPVATALHLRRVIDVIYEAGLHPEVWPTLVNTMLSDVAGILPVSSCEGMADEQSATERSIAGHLVQALSLSRYVGEQEGVAYTLEPLLATLAFPLLVVESSLRVLYVGAHCSEFLRTRAEIRLEDGRLTINDARVRACLDDFFDKECQSPPGAAEISLDQCDGIRVYVLPLRLADGTRLCLLAWFDAKLQTRRHGGELAGVYSLTRAEAELLDGLLSDQSYTALASSRGVMENTVRSQVKQIFSKTYSHSRSELVQKVLCGPELLRRMVSVHTENGTRGLAETPRRNQRLHHAAGHHIGFAEYGVADGTPVLLMHEFSGSRLQLPVSESRLFEQGIRLIMPDRPGVGLSDPVEDPTMSYWTECVEHLLDHLGIQKSLLMGGSIGGRYALAAAAKMPTRFERLCLVSTVAELDAEDDFSLMDEDMQKLFRLICRLPTNLARLVLQLIMRGMQGNQIDQRIRQLPEADQAMYRDAAFYELSISVLKENLRNGGSQMIFDLLMLTRPWEFSVEEVRLPVQCWHGSLDITSPLTSVERLVRRLPDCRLRIEPRETHLQIYRQWNTILACLINPELFVDHIPST